MNIRAYAYTATREPVRRDDASSNSHMILESRVIPHPPRPGQAAAKHPEEHPT